MKHVHLPHRETTELGTESNKPRPHPARLLILLATVAVATAAVLFAAERYELWSWTRATFSSVEAMREFVAGFGGWAPAVFFLVQVLQVVLAPVPGGVAVVVGTLLFGVWGGLALSVAGATAGSAVLFLAVRRWGRPLALRLAGREAFKRYAGVLDRKGALLFAILLVPFTPDDVVCALAGLSKVSLRRFVVLVAVGRTPSWLATALVTAELATRSAAVWIGAALAVAALLALGLWHRKRLEGWALGWVGKRKERRANRRSDV